MIEASAFSLQALFCTVIQLVDIGRIVKYVWRQTSAGMFDPSLSRIFGIDFSEVSRIFAQYSITLFLSFTLFFLVWVGWGEAWTTNHQIMH